MYYYELLIAIGYAVRAHYRAAYQRLVETCDCDAEIENALSLLRASDDWVNNDLIVQAIQMEG